MRLSRLQLRRLIEAEVDKMRLPRGPNSRDDGDDDFVEQKPVTEVTGFEPRTPDNEVDVSGELVAAGEHIEMAVQRLQRALAADRAQGGALDTHVKAYVKNVLHKLVADEIAATLKSQ